MTNAEGLAIFVALVLIDGSAAVVGQSSAKFQPGQSDACAVQGLVQSLARTRHVPLGFQLLPRCEAGGELAGLPGKFVHDRSVRTGDMSSARPEFSDSTPLKDVLSALLPAEYSWRLMDGIAVVRPVAAWSDGDDPLNQTIDELRMEDVSVGRAFESVLGKPCNPCSGDGRTFWGRPVSLSVPAGPLLAALNALMKQSGAAGWDAIVYAPPDDTSDRTLIVGMRDRGRAFGPGFSLSVKVKDLRRGKEPASLPDRIPAA